MMNFRLVPRPEVRSVNVVVGRGLFDEATPSPIEASPRVVLVVDSLVLEAERDRVRRIAARLGGEVIPEITLRVTREKGIDQAMALWSAFSTRGVDRKTRVVLVGGGSLLDVGAFAAATWLRGVQTVVVPTTLLAQVDAGLGGKCGVDLGGRKNQIGVIEQPEAVLVDVAFLDSLPPSEWRSGVGEVLKTALLSGGDLYDRVSALDHSSLPMEVDSIVFRCLQKKASLVERDPNDDGERTVLNLGHTVAHVLESLAREDGQDLSHGEAVAIGVLAEIKALSEDAALSRTVFDLITRHGLPTTFRLRGGHARIRHVLLSDKKRSGAGIRVPILRAPGVVELCTLDLERLIPAVDAAITTI